MDNVVVAFELMHSLKWRNNGKKGWLSLKFDMSKAYDRVEWVFLEAVIEKMGFSVRWKSLILECIFTAKFSCVINRKAKGRVIPQRGIRQGCPLSPYLFLLYAKRLSSLISHAEKNGSLHGFSYNRNSPRISHLFFVDYSMVFCKANMDNYNTLLSLLNQYSKASSQLVF